MTNLTLHAKEIQRLLGEMSEDINASGSTKSLLNRLLNDELPTLIAWVEIDDRRHPGLGSVYGE